ADNPVLVDTCRAARSNESDRPESPTEAHLRQNEDAIRLDTDSTKYDRYGIARNAKRKQLQKLPKKILFLPESLQIQRE
ncbi:hypothetical protein L9F63_019977, partial [Diploptera punctata]